MRQFPVGPEGKAYVWIDEEPGAAFTPLGVIRRSAETGAIRPRWSKVAIEAHIHMGPRFLYGLLGITVPPSIGADGLWVDVPYSGPDGAAWESPFGKYESAHIGLWDEYADAVLDGLSGAVDGILAPCTVRVSAAAHGAVSSNSVFFGKLARAAIGILLLDDHADDALQVTLVRALLPGLSLERKDTTLDGPDA